MVSVHYYVFLCNSLKSAVIRQNVSENSGSEEKNMEQVGKQA